MKTINRTVVTVTPEQPFIDWANSFNDNGPQLEPSELYPTSYLIPDNYDELSYDKFIRQRFTIIFEAELSSWMLDPADWPKDRSYKAFKQWFDIRVSDTVFDLGSGKIEHEEF